MQSRPLSYAEMGTYDVVVIVTDHRYYEPEQILRHARRIVDTRNLTAGAGRNNPRW
jgi:UDP-N-acetyl-D-mannosaminuronate dehydrogenase